MNSERTFRVIYFFTSAHESLNVNVRKYIIFLNFYRLFQTKYMAVFVPVLPLVALVIAE